MINILKKIFRSKSLLKQELADELIEASLDCGHAFIEKNSRNEKNIGIVTGEVLFFYMHMLNRISFSNGGKRAQEKLYDNISNIIGEKMASIYDSDEHNKFLDIFREGIIGSEKIYSKCDGLVAKEGQSHNNTLLWEAAKRVSQSMDTAEIMMAHELLRAGLETLKLQVRVRQFM